MTGQAREQLALRMVSTLPRYGSWATSFRDFETPYGKLGFRQLAILWALRYELLPERDMTPTRIAALNHVQPSVITRALDKLEHGGFITRTVSPKDHRSFYIALTDKGLEASVFVERLYIDEITSSMAFLDDHQISDLARNVDVLDDIASNLEQQRIDSKTKGRVLE